MHSKIHSILARRKTWFNVQVSMQSIRMRPLRNPLFFYSIRTNYIAGYTFLVKQTIISYNVSIDFHLLFFYYWKSNIFFIYIYDISIFFISILICDWSVFFFYCNNSLKCFKITSLIFSFEELIFLHFWNSVYMTKTKF